MFRGKPPKPKKLLDVPNAQQPARHGSTAQQAEHRDLTTKVSKGVMAIIAGPRGQFIPHKAKLDLCVCLELLESEAELPFDWDISMYFNP